MMYEKVQRVGFWYTQIDVEVLLAAETPNATSSLYVARATLKVPKGRMGARALESKLAAVAKSSETPLSV